MSSTNSTSATTPAESSAGNVAAGVTGIGGGGGVSRDQWRGFARGQGGEILGVAAAVATTSSRRSSPQPTAYRGEWEDLVKDPASLLACLHRLHALNEAVCFWNKEKSVKLLLRNNPESGPDTLSAELAILEGALEGEADVFTAIMTLDIDSWEDGDAWIMEEFNVDREEIADCEVVREATASINKAYNIRICQCENYLIREPDCETCSFCLLTSHPSDYESHHCPICYNHGPRLSFTKQNCCGQLIHQKCLTKWYNTSAASHCPWCRHDQTTVA